MSADSHPRPVPSKHEPEVIDLEVVDEGYSPSTGAPRQPQGPDLQDMLKMGPEMVGQMFRNMLLQRHFSI